jgi:U3 small nucleolar ribonucleoprotein protein LCP5
MALTKSENRLQQTDELTYDKGISLLTIKNDLFLAYLHHLTLLAHLKLSGRSLAQHGDLVHELVRLRVILDKIRPLESKLKYQVEKLVRKVQAEADKATMDDDDVINGAAAQGQQPARR